MTNGKQILTDMVDGLEGVKAGPWHQTYEVTRFGPDERLTGFILDGDDVSIGIIDEDPSMMMDSPSPTLDHLARCSPDNIKAIAAYVAELEAKLDRQSTHDLEGKEG